jgi:hypothetical protein
MVFLNKRPLRGMGGQYFMTFPTFRNEPEKLKKENNLLYGLQKNLLLLFNTILIDYRYYLTVNSFIQRMNYDYNNR